jgi:outer membrane protein
MQKTMSSIIITIACAANISFACAEDLLSVYQQAKANDPVLLKTEAQYMAAKEDIIQKVLFVAKLNR